MAGPRETRENALRRHVLADTFYWIALALPADASYAKARQTKAHIVTTDEVLSEYLNFFSNAPPYLRRQVAASLPIILRNPTVRVIEQSRATFLAVAELFRARPDKGYSLIDCISMQTMYREGSPTYLPMTDISSRKTSRRCFAPN